MKIIFFGTPKFASDILTYLFEKKVNIAAVVTQKDLIRNNKAFISEVKKTGFFYLNEEDVYQPEKASDVIFLEKLKKYSADLFVVVAYGQILSQKLLDIPKKGCINVHGSLLPKYRGAAPIQHAILNGEKKTGITIMKMVKKMDAGEIIMQEEIDIPADMVFTQLEEKMCEIAKPLLLEVIKKYKKNDITFIEQDEDQVTFAPKITKEIRRINFQRPSIFIYNQIRAFANKPGAWLEVLINKSKKELKIFKSQLSDIKLKPKEIKVGKDFFLIGTEDNALKILEVQLEGKKKMRAFEFIKGVKNTLEVF